MISDLSTHSISKGRKEKKEKKKIERFQIQINVEVLLFRMEHVEVSKPRRQLIKISSIIRV